jgi:bifunctional DNA-binding transcriptional regulator/antitoxin component of YhaV-PrlF toxin-antitoxin module
MQYYVKKESKAMTPTLNHERVSITPTGTIELSARFREAAGLKPGDELLVIWLPPDTFIMRKWSEVVADDELFAATMHEFDQALSAAGYITNEDVRRLVREVKQDQYTDWSKD